MGGQQFDSKDCPTPQIGAQNSELFFFLLDNVNSYLKKLKSPTLEGCPFRDFITFCGSF